MSTNDAVVELKQRLRRARHTIHAALLVSPHSNNCAPPQFHVARAASALTGPDSSWRYSGALSARSRFFRLSRGSGRPDEVGRRRWFRGVRHPVEVRHPVVAPV